jgi:hypothetical protein
VKLHATFAVLFAACGTTPDEREPTFEVVTLEVLAPTCGQVQCHSTSTNLSGFAFDTLDASRVSLRSASKRGEVLEQVRENEMPPDAPMADADKALLQEWIFAGAPGL